MTQEEKKAEELIDKFMFADIYFTDGKRGAIRNAIFCAALSVDETIKALTRTIDHVTLKRLDYFECQRDLEFHQSVKSILTNKQQ